MFYYRAGVFIRIFILAIIVAIGWATPAKAETACHMIDKVLASVSLVRDIQVEGGKKNNPENMFKLVNVVDQISLSTIFPQQSLNSLSVENEVLFQYLSKIREAVAAEMGNVDGSAQQTLSYEITREFINSIQSVEYYWQCRDVEASPPSTGEGLLENSIYFEAPDNSAYSKVAGAQDELFDPVIAKSKAHSRSTNSSVSERANFTLPALGTVSSPATIVIVILTLVMIFVFVRKRTKNFIIREKRRFLNEPVEVKIGDANYSMYVLDISMNGCKILHKKAIQKQRKLSIQLDGNWYLGQIRWSNEQYAGVKFVKPISKQTLSTVMGPY